MKKIIFILAFLSLVVVPTQAAELILRTNQTEFMDDSWVEKLDPNTNFGLSTTIILSSTPSNGDIARGYFKFSLVNLTTLGITASQITNATLHLKINFNDSTYLNISLLDVYLDNWTETSVLWPNQPCGGADSVTDGTRCNTTPYYNVTGYTGSQDLIIPALNLIKVRVNNNNKNVSMAVIVNNMTALALQQKRFWSKDNGDFSLTGYLNITYTPTSAITPNVTIRSPTNTTYLFINHVLLNFSYTDGDNTTANCSRRLDNNAFVNLGIINNNTANVTNISSLTNGLHNITVFCTDGTNSGSSTVWFSMFSHAVNLSAYLVNLSNLSLWNVTFANSTTTLSSTLNNNTGTFYNGLPLGSVTVQVTKSGYDNETLSITLNDTIQFVQRNATLYPLNYVYFYDLTNSVFLNGFTVYIAASGVNSTASGSFFSISSRNLSITSSIITASLTGYATNSTTLTPSNLTGFNVTINTTQVTMTFQALDEITLQQLGFTVNMYLKGTNTTLRNAVGFRLGQLCFYDTDEATSCLATTATEAGSGATSRATSWTIQGFGQNLVYFKLVWKKEHTSSPATQSSTVTIFLQNGSTVYTDTQTADGTYTAYVSLDNSRANMSSVENLTVNISATVAGSISDTVTTRVLEFRFHNNSAGYFYSGIVNNSIYFPTSITSGYTTVDAWFSGASAMFMPDYTTPRMYRLSFSAASNFNFNAYLLNDSLGYIQYLSVLDPNNAPIDNVPVTIQNWYSGVATTVVQCASNPTGSCAVFVRRYVEYYLTAQKTGYTTIQRDVVFTGLPNPANLYLSGNTNSNYTSVFNGISLSISPGVENQNQSFNTTCSVTASEGNLNFLNYTIYRQANNTLSMYNSTYSASVPTGSAFRMQITPRGRYIAECTLQWVSNATGVTTTYQASYRQAYWNYQDPGQGIGGDAVDSMMGLGIYILIILGVCIPLSRVSGGLAMFAGIGILLMAAFTEIFTWNTIQGNLGWYLAGLTILVVFALFALRNRV